MHYTGLQMSRAAGFMAAAHSQLRICLAEVTCMSWSRIKYGADFQTLMSQELPYFRAAGTCGNCGDTSDLSDRAWVDFLAYVQWKAIARQLSGKRQQVNLSPGSYWEAMHNPMPTNDQYESNGTDCGELGVFCACARVRGRSALAFYGHRSPWALSRSL